MRRSAFVAVSVTCVRSIAGILTTLAIAPASASSRITGIAALISILLSSPSPVVGRLDHLVFMSLMVLITSVKSMPRPERLLSSTLIIEARLLSTFETPS